MPQRNRFRPRPPAGCAAALLTLLLTVPPADAAGITGPPGSAGPPVSAASPAAPSAPSAPSTAPEDEQRAYYGDDLMKLLFMIRLRMEGAQPHRAFQPTANAAFVLVDPTGLTEAELDAYEKNPPRNSGPLVVYQKLDLATYERYLPAAEAERLRRAGARHLLLVGGLSFSSGGKESGHHSETLVLRALDTLRGKHPQVEATELTWASDRRYCPDCRSRVSPHARRFHAFEYGLTDAELAARDERIAAARAAHSTLRARQKAVAAIEAEYKTLAAQRMMRAQAGLTEALPKARDTYREESEQRYQDETSDVLHTGDGACARTSANRASLHRAAFPRADRSRRSGPPPAARPCPPDDGTRVSGLAKALADPAATPGGIDFTSLELRYLADSGRGLRYSFSAGTGGGADRNGPAAGVAAARESSDAFFVWLSLPRSTFWVNLNPAEPDRLVDAELGRTDVGRILLQADLRLKKTTAALIHPKSRSGRTFWDRVGGTCMAFRTWIVPGEARVHEKDGELYILDAPLTVRTESQHLSGDDKDGRDGGEGGGGTVGCGGTAQDRATARRNEQTFRELILPGIEKAVNHDAAYASLRRVFLSRVAAEWYRERAARARTSYGDLVDRGDVSRWRTRTAWKPRDTFDAYVDSYRNGEFKVTDRTREGDHVYTRTYVFGGVDFSRLTLRRVPSDLAFRGRWAGMRQDTARSTGAARPAADGTAVWLGGDHTAPAAGGGPGADGADSPDGGDGPDTGVGPDGGTSRGAAPRGDGASDDRAPWWRPLGLGGAVLVLVLALRRRARRTRPGP